MKRLAMLSGAALAACICLPACSGGDKESFGAVDHDKDGKIIYEEAFFVFPDLTEEKFAAYDKNNDGTLNLEEYAALYAAATAQAQEPPAPAPSVAEEPKNDAPAAPADAARASKPQPAPRPAQSAQTQAPASGQPAGAPPITNEDLISVTIVSSPGDAAKAVEQAPAAPQAHAVTAPAAPAISEPPSATSAQTAGAPRKYTVAKGDILIKIAQKFNVTVNDIIKANPGLNPDAIRHGQEIVIP